MTVFGRRSAEFVKLRKKSMVPEEEHCSALHEWGSKFRPSLLTGRQAANCCCLVLSTAVFTLTGQEIGDGVRCLTRKKICDFVIKLTTVKHLFRFCSLGNAAEA